MKVAIHGAGLMGTSLGLALTRGGHHVNFLDTRVEHANLADARTDHSFDGRADLFVAACPTEVVASVIFEAKQQDLALIFTDIASTKFKVQLEINTFHLEASYCGGHPMAGSERTGPSAARSDLFEGRPWVITPSDATAPEVIERVNELVKAVGAIPVRMTPIEHDQAVAQVSHAAQVVASLLAARLGQVPEQYLSIAGQGLRDTTRIAGSSPEIWAPILAQNAAEIGAFLTPLVSDLQDFLDLISKDGPERLQGLSEFIARGRAGRERIPGKHGGPLRLYDQISVVLPDRPGQLALLFALLGEIGVNVEDIAMEHSPGLQLGLVQLSLPTGLGPDVIVELVNRGWRAFAVSG